MAGCEAVAPQKNTDVFITAAQDQIMLLSVGKHLDKHI